MNCPNCDCQHIVRLKREGFLRERIFPLFGLYPWKCPKCKVACLLRGRGKRRKKLTPHHSSSS
jgi:hypothetical protein